MRAAARDENRYHHSVPGKKEKLSTILADPRFDDGITIVERYKFGLSPLTQDLGERSLLGYIALLRANDTVHHNVPGASGMDEKPTTALKETMIKRKNDE